MRIVLVPTLEEQEWLLDELAQLVTDRGATSILTHPILPTATHFPDAWQRDLASVNLLADRLLCFAGLTTLKAQCYLFDSDEAGATDEHGLAVAACFWGIFDNVCLFGICEAKLSSPVEVVGAMAHEVAHAYRRFHGLELLTSHHGAPPSTSDLPSGKELLTNTSLAASDDGDDQDSLRQREEQLTDLTTVFLGFGVLTANSAHVVHTWTEYHGSNIVAQMSKNELGYLPPNALAFMLAAQAEAIADPAVTKSIRKHLAANQLAYFDAARKVLKKTPARGMLAIATDQHAIPREIPPALALEIARGTSGAADFVFVNASSLEESGRDDDTSDHIRSELHLEDEAHPNGSESDPIFRVNIYSTGSHAFFGSLAFITAMALALWFIGAIDTPATNRVYFAMQRVEVYLFGALFFGLLGGASGRRLGVLHCSECRVPLAKPAGSGPAPPAEAWACPECHRTTIGDIASYDDRLDAIEAYELTRKSPAGPVN
ncbi:MAG: hypothetical protein IPL79_10540 [Myxococcales bacterium]|nr:hypothetical protein [Myxococcales bacterium]